MKGRHKVQLYCQDQGHLGEIAELINAIPSLSVSSRSLGGASFNSKVSVSFRSDLPFPDTEELLKKVLAPQIQALDASFRATVSYSDSGFVVTVSGKRAVPAGGGL